MLDSSPVHMYSDIFESETLSFRIRLPIHTYPANPVMRISNFLNPLSTVEILKYAKNLEFCGRSNPDIFKSDEFAANSQRMLYWQ